MFQPFFFLQHKYSIPYYHCHDFCFHQHTFLHIKIFTHQKKNSMRYACIHVAAIVGIITQVCLTQILSRVKNDDCVMWHYVVSTAWQHSHHLHQCNRMYFVSCNDMNKINEWKYWHIFPFKKNSSSIDF